MTASFGISFEVFPPDVATDLLWMESFYRAYAAGIDGEFLSRWDLTREVRKGHVIPAVVAIGGEVVAYFGVELMAKPYPWLNLLYFSGRFDRRIARAMVWQLYRMLQFYKLDLGRHDEVGAVKIAGRPGWRRIAANMGISMDRNGVVLDNQKGLTNGYLRRFQ